jgi:four helix bundle protein
MENTHEKNFTFFRFEDLRIYHKALDYVKLIHKFTVDFEKAADVQLAEKFSNASHNIALNIAEGSARNKSQFIYYLKMAKSAVRECLVYNTIAYNADLISEASEIESRGQLMEMTKMIGALISSLQRTITKDDEEEIEERIEANTY